MSLLFSFLLWSFPPVSARAQGEGEPESIEGAAQTEISQEGLAREMQERIQADPAVADSLAQRISRSSLAERFSQSPDEAARLAAIRRWVASDPASAARLAVGLAKDDAEGSHRFENALNHTVWVSHEAKINKNKGAFGRLKKAGVDSKLMKKDVQMTEEEQSEIINVLFEGRSGKSSQIITQEERGKPGKEGAGASAALSTSYYDRLSQTNLRGYSPQLQAIQSALNSRRAPGAPKLIETGKLDYETLSYPGYGMRFDAGNLERRLRYQRNFALAQLAGRERELSAEQLLDPSIEIQLKTQAAAKGKPNARFERRQAHLERAQAAVRDFERAALAAKDPAKITRDLLMTLGSKQKEAARWITAASLEEELQWVESQEKFLSPELAAAIAACPVPGGAKDAYRRRGEKYRESLSKLKTNDETAVKALESDGWLSQMEAVQKILDENASLRQNLSRNIQDYVRAPFRLAALGAPKPRWRALLDRYVKRYLPSTAYARGLMKEDSERNLLKDVFVKIASGDLDAAHTILASAGLDTAR